ncbi:hypothetical protein N7488_003208 [Penicillium malachiteum]|nr:hypothetical protein N7488_003208 [Penicillium malachiteum]
MNFPRRRAPIACNFCRQSISEVTCDYQDPAAAAAVAAVTENAASSGKESNGGSKKSATAADMMRRLDELEKLIREQKNSAAPAELAKSSEPKDSWCPPTSIEDDAGVTAFLSTMWIPSEMSFLSNQPPLNNTSPGVLDTTNLQWSPGIGGPHIGNGQHIEDEPSNIPIGHLTPTSSLFSLDQIKRLIGEYPEDFFLQIETTRQFEPQAPESPLNIEKDVSEALIASFFAEILPHFPILNPDSFGTSFDGVFFDGKGDESSRALCLIVLALGKLASNRQACSPGQYTEDDGLEYFARAYYRLTPQWITSFHFNLPLASGLVSCAIYLCYLERPLHAWRLVYMASSKVQMLASQ